MPVETLLNVLADHAAEVDEIAEDRAAAHHERMLRLLWVPEERDEDLWLDAFDALGLDEEWLEFDVSEMNAIPKDERDLEWQAVMATLIAVSKWQATIDTGILETLLKAADRHALEGGREAGRLGAAGLKDAAKRGISKQLVKEAKVRREDGRRVPAPRDSD